MFESNTKYKFQYAKHQYIIITLQGRSLRGAAPPPPEFSEFCKENGRLTNIFYTSNNFFILFDRVGVAFLFVVLAHHIYVTGI